MFGRAIPYAAIAALCSLVTASACSHEHKPSSTGVTSMQGPGTVPNTPTASNVQISSELLRACNIAEPDAYFAFDSSQLHSMANRIPLDAIANCFLRGPMKGRQLRLIGHSDSRGDGPRNVALGQSRANAVASYLVERGMNSSMLVIVSRGAMDATGHDEAGWARDRRVDVFPGP
jgi:peptidoglycan-associated lipoprotein